MDDLYSYYFEHLDKTLENEFKGKVNQRFRQLVDEFREEAKYAAKFSKRKDDMHRVIDWYFDRYLQEKSFREFMQQSA